MDGTTESQVDIPTSVAQKQYLPTRCKIQAAFFWRYTETLIYPKNLQQWIMLSLHAVSIIT